MNINAIVLAVSNLLEVYIIYRLMNVFFDGKVRNRRGMLFAYMLRYVLTYVVTLWYPVPIVNLLVSIITLVLIALIYCSNATKKIIVISEIVGCQLISEVCSVVILNISNCDVLKLNDLNFVELFMPQFFFWIIYIFVQRFLNVKKNIILPIPFLIITIFSIILVCIFLVLIAGKKDLTLSQIKYYIAFFVMVVFFMLIFFHDFLSKIFVERVEYEKINSEKEYYLKYLQELQESDKKIRQIRHDMKNQLLVMQQLIYENDIKNLKEYVDGLNTKLENTQLYCQTGNIAVDSVTNYKLTQAKERNIQVLTDIKIPSNLYVNQDDLTVLLGNLLDNAIEAQKNINKKNFIKVKMECIKNTLYIITENSYDGFVEIDNGQILTRKKEKDNHGIGLQSIKAIVKKYHGDIKIAYDAQVFTVKIMLYL